MSEIRVVDLGRRPYQPVLDLQRALVRARLEGSLTSDLLLLVEHQPVVTLGRGTRESSLPISRPALEARGFDVVEVERGGDVTVHAPGQLVGYPIIDLQSYRPDLHWYLRQLEEALIRALGALGIEAGRNPGLTGVWVGPRKIASIGVHVKRWVTLHGFALNVMTDLSAFDVVVPCGISGVVMTSVEREAGGRTDGLWSATREAVIAGFGAAFDRSMVSRNLQDLPGVQSAI
ncbi:MAG TPA: lipoyl(octanoyl) transferase LipB [Gemmatimonadales bacterium]|jgi:lipoate-protein ligase B